MFVGDPSLHSKLQKITRKKSPCLCLNMSVSMSLSHVSFPSLFPMSLSHVSVSMSLCPCLCVHVSVSMSLCPCLFPMSLSHVSFSRSLSPGLCLQVSVSRSLSPWRQRHGKETWERDMGTETWRKRHGDRDMETFKLTIHVKKTKDHFFPCNTNINILHFYQSNPISIKNENLHYEHNFTYLGIEIDYL